VAERIAIVVPCRNEMRHIDAFLASALEQQLPEGSTLQVVVADGASDDGTAERLRETAAREPRLLVIDNPARITSTGLNRAIMAAEADIVVRMDVHTSYASDYVLQCVRTLHSTGAACVGGAWRPVGEGFPQRAIARAFQSRFGSGGAASRRAALDGPVDTVYLGAWWRSALLSIGAFDESLARNQDDELALRITRAGGVVWQSSSIRSWYVPRASFGALFQQFWQYGYWKLAVIRKHKAPASLRHLVPVTFVALLLGLALAGLAWRPSWWGLVGLLGVYTTAALVSAWPLAAGSIRDALGIAWAFACMQLGYGAGFARALVDFVLLRRRPGAAATRLTR